MQNQQTQAMKLLGNPARKRRWLLKPRLQIKIIHNNRIMGFLDGLCSDTIFSSMASLSALLGKSAIFSVAETNSCALTDMLIIIPKGFDLIITSVNLL